MAGWGTVISLAPPIALRLSFLALMELWSSLITFLTAVELL